MEPKVKVICVEKKFAKNINTFLKQENKVNAKYRITSKNSNFVYIPVKDLSGMLLASSILVTFQHSQLDEECNELVRRSLKEEFGSVVEYVENIDPKELYSSKSPNLEGLSGAEQVRSVLQR